jgi:hypothetical protein
MHTAMHTATLALARARTFEDIAKALMAAGTNAMGANSAAVILLGADGWTVERADTDGHPAIFQEAWRSFPAAGASPLTDAMLERRVLMIPSVETLSARYPHLWTPGDRPYGLLALPLVQNQDLFGGLSLLFRYGDDPGTGAHSSIVKATPDALMGTRLAALAATRVAHTYAVAALEDRVSQLQQALDSRIVIEQAKGALSRDLGVDVEVAFTILRRYARSHNRPLRDVAIEVIQGRLAGRVIMRAMHP